MVYLKNGSDSILKNVMVKKIHMPVPHLLQSYLFAIEGYELFVAEAPYNIVLVTDPDIV